MQKRTRIIAVVSLAALLLSAAAWAAPKHKKHKTKPVTRSAPAPSTVAAPAASTTAPADPNLITLQTVSGMASAGAPALALKLMDQDQPDFAADAVGWMSWERERLYIYQAGGDWHAVIGRAEHLPKDASPDFRAWEEMQAADAWLHLGEGGKARALVLPLVWDAKSPPDDRELALLRRLIIRSYIANDRLPDAQTAVIRYRQDYPKDSGDWPLLEARLFLKTQQPQAALDVLQDVEGPEADMLALLASLRDGELAPADALGQAVKIGSDSKASETERVHAWVIAAEAADDLKNPAARISALQDGLGLQEGLLDQDDVFKLTPDMLWDAYAGYGDELGNDLQLVVGDDQAWFVAASNLYDSDPIRAAALFTVVAYHAADPQQAKVAHWQFASLIQKQRFGGVVLRRLYLDSSRFKDVATIPADVRYLLVDDVLDIPNIPLASELMQGLDTPPPDTTPGAWQLKRAHVFILGGDPDAGVAALKELLAPKQPAPAPSTATGAKPAPQDAPVDADDVLQVLFDLQTLHRDKDAIPFFEVLLKMPLVPEQRRQMLYWTADSYKALGDYAKAAELYLRSAMLLDPYSMDQWAQTARYQAAQMLAKAGYVDDARNLYKGLLNATRDPSQQAVLQHDLQQLMLMPAKGGHR
ncbi:MAG TPA: hypothetical protein VGV16_04295 [Gammaproteobacteria bacterium]|nr:hypothetical protein [Gammaproteobacteria bacterium]